MIELEAQAQQAAGNRTSSHVGEARKQIQTRGNPLFPPNRSQKTDSSENNSLSYWNQDYLTLRSVTMEGQQCGGRGQEKCFEFTDRHPRL